MRRSLILALAAILTTSTGADAGWLRHGHRRPCQAAPRYHAQPMPIGMRSVPSVAPATPMSATSGDFVSWLNRLRSARGLSPVVWDAALASDAAVNNASQQARGLGHFYMGRARRQNAAIGGNFAANWLASPAHAAAMFDPSIRSVGVASAGNYTTASFR